MDAGGGSPVPEITPAPMPSSNAVPPFLMKTYDMVDDPSTDKIVSWSPTDSSFVIWDPPEFAKQLLPKYFKHSNFSSFVRQLNTYVCISLGLSWVFSDLTVLVLGYLVIFSSMLGIYWIFWAEMLIIDYFIFQFE